MDISGYQIQHELDHNNLYSRYSAVHLASSKKVTLTIFSEQAKKLKNFNTYFDQLVTASKHPVASIQVLLHNCIIQHDLYTVISDHFNSEQCIIKQLNLLSEANKFNVAYQISKQLSELHQLNIFHNNIDLNNIFLNSKGVVSIGLVSHEFQLDSINSIHEIPSNEIKFFPSDIKQGISESTDFFRLGVLLFELIFGIKPTINAQDNNYGLSSQKISKYKNIFDHFFHAPKLNKIKSDFHFQALCKNNGVSLTEIPFTQNKSIDLEEIAEPKKSNSSIFIIVVLILILIGIYFFLNNFQQKPEAQYIEREQPTLINNNSNQNNQISQVSENTETDSTSNGNEQFESLYSNAQTSLNSNKYAAALMVINDALNIKPEDSNAIELKLKIKKEFQIQTLIKTAESQISRGSLLLPAGNNAMTTYNKIKKIVPDNDPRVAQGIENIARKYYELTVSQLNQNNRVRAKTLIAAGLRVSPNFVPLINLNNRINTLENTELADQQKAENDLKIALLNEQRELKLKTQNKALLAEQQRRQKEAEQRQIEVEIKRQQLGEKTRLNIETQRIESLYRSAKSQLKVSPLRLTNLASAKQNLLSISKINAKSAIQNQLFKEINQAYIRLSEIRTNEQLYIEALTTIDAGLIHNPSETKLSNLKTIINFQIIAEKEKEKAAQERKKAELEPPKQPVKEPELLIEEEIPIFGTF